MKKLIKQRLDRMLIQLFSCTLRSKHIVKYMVVILYEFCYTIHFELWFPDPDDWICSWNTVNLALFDLFFKDRAFPDTNIDVHS